MPRRFLLQYLALTVALGAATYIALQAFQFAAVGVDDANIFFVYGEHLTRGEGLVWNSGSERVEGYSSTLWMLVIAMVTWLPLPLEATLRALSALIVAAALTLLIVQATGVTRREGSQWTTPSLTLLIWTLAAPGYAVWCCLSLMDTGLWSALLITGTALLLQEARSETTHRPIAFSALIVALLLSRPEGMLWGLVFVAGLTGIVWRRKLRFPLALKRALPAVISYGVTLGGLTLFRLLYFGYPLPNTYYAKMSPDLVFNLTSGAAYLYEFLLSNWMLWPAVAAALWGAGAYAMRLARRGAAETGSGRLELAIVSAIVLVGLGVPVLVGGDHFRLFRFYQPIWPLLIVPPLMVVIEILDSERAPFSHLARIPRLAGLALLALVFLASARPGWLSLPKDDISWEFRLAKQGRDVGAYITASFAGAELPAVGVIATGGFGYAYGGDAVDLMGLNLTQMAHHPGERKGVKNHAAFSEAVFYQLQPELILPYLIDSPVNVPPYGDTEWIALTLKGLLSRERFREGYATAVIRPRALQEEIYLAAIFRRDYLDWLSRTGAFQVWPVRYSGE